MKAILRVTNPTPLCFRTSRFDKSVNTCDYIPGATLLGGLAAAHCRSDRSKEEFAEFFTSGQIRFGNLYPANFGELSRGPVYPIPATAVSCKRFEGFKFLDRPMEEEGDRHGVSDQLIHWTLFSLTDMKDAKILLDAKKCSCGNPTNLFSGFYRQNGGWDEIAKSGISKRMITRTGISRKRRAVMDKILYNREVLEEEQIFQGILDLKNQEQMDRFKEFMEDASDDEMIYLGNNRTRGFGRINYSTFRAPDEDEFISDIDPDKIRRRVERFNTRLQEKAKVYRISVPDNTIYIPITLLSDVILKDDLLRCRRGFTADYFSSQWNLEGMTPVYRSIGMRRVMSWNGIYKLPDSDDAAITMGSVFLFGYTGEVDDRFWQTLWDMQNQGIGERRCEGFGDIRIADEFHTEVNEIWMNE